MRGALLKKARISKDTPYKYFGQSDTVMSAFQALYILNDFGTYKPKRFVFSLKIVSHNPCELSEFLFILFIFIYMEQQPWIGKENSEEVGGIIFLRGDWSTGKGFL